MRVMKSFFARLIVVGILGICAVAVVYAVNFVGNGAATVQSNGGPIINVSVNCTSQCGGVLNPQGRAPVLAQTATLGPNMRLSIDGPSPSNYVQAVPASGINATLTLNLDAHIDVGPTRYDSPNDMVLVSNGTVPSFPPQGPVNYTLQNTVVFSHGGESITLFQGSHVTLVRQ